MLWWVGIWCSVGAEDVSAGARVPLECALRSVSSYAPYFPFQSTKWEQIVPRHPNRTPRCVSLGSESFSLHSGLCGCGRKAGMVCSHCSTALKEMVGVGRGHLGKLAAPCLLKGLGGA